MAASQSRQWPMLTMVLYHTAMLMVREAEALGASHPSHVTRQERAVELLASISQHPATWHAYHHRARRLIEELRQGLPGEMSEATVGRGQQVDWQVSVAALIDELDRNPDIVA